jgi:ectoine hydroxylase-related dioxygenase (phytanoyl-CoA dioxygenase family)
MTSFLADSPIFSTLPETVPLRRYGYEVLRHPDSQATFPALKRAFAELIRTRLSSFCGKDIPSFECEAYHEAIARVGVDHHAFIQATRRTLPEELIAQPHLPRLVEIASSHVGKRLRLYSNNMEYRVVRPSISDNNPWHRDHWFPYFTPLINVYLPLSGSFVDSALQVVPFSHLWTDEDCVPTRPYDGGKTNKGGVLYSVPEIKECKFPIRGHRMDVLPGDFALFSPRMVHGEGSNTSPVTRFSFEFRLEVAP